MDSRTSTMSEEAELYIHIPFCVKKCSYCDFLSFPADESTQEKYIGQLISELRYRAALLEGRTICSCFIGGGTPSVISEWLIAALMDAIARYYHLSNDAEITIECNPSSVMRHKFASYKKSGINRLSIGVQSANNAELKMLGRVHTYEEFLKAYQSARMEGFSNINVDLINCFPMQSIKTWRKTLRSVCMLRPEHISVYNLIIEEGTPFYEMNEKGLLLMPSEDEQAEIDAFTRSCLKQHGYHRYEISNYAREGYECRHNKGYWTGREYLGFGIGASSYYGGYRWKNISGIRDYLALTPDDLEPGGMSAGLCTDMEKLSREDMMSEYMYLGLRMIRGVSADEFRIKFGQTAENVFGDAMEKHTASGLMVQDGDYIRLTERGIDVSNVVLADFLLK